MKSDTERAGTPAVVVQRFVSQPHRVQLSRRNGWRLPPNTVVVARPTKWGNPWKVGAEYIVAQEGGDRTARFTATECVSRYKLWLARNPHIVARARNDLRGKNLACWCKLDAPCHADVLLKLANEKS